MVSRAISEANLKVVLVGARGEAKPRTTKGKVPIRSSKSSNESRPTTDFRCTAELLRTYLHLRSCSISDCGGGVPARGACDESHDVAREPFTACHIGKVGSAAIVGRWDHLPY